MPNLRINNTDLWYTREGKGRPIIFLHAFAVTGAMWFPQISAFTDAGYKIICIDLRGHGQSSSPPGPYTVSGMAEDIHLLITHLKLDNVCVVGLSTGGRVAMRLAIDHPKDITKLVLVSSKSEPALDIQVALDILSQKIEQGEMVSAIDEWYDNYYQRLTDNSPELVKTMKEEWYRKEGNGLAGVGLAIAEMESMTTRVSEIKAPTLAVAGALDPSCHPFVAWYEKAIPDCRGSIVPGAAHFVNLEQPDHFNDLLLAFLETQTR